MQQESNSSASCGMMNMDQYSTPARIRSAVANLMSPPSYSPIFYQPSSSSAQATSPANTNSPGGNASSSSAAAISSLSRLMTEHQELRSLYAQCMTQMQRTFKEAETLRQENTNLRMANHDLNLLIQAALENHYQKAMFHDTSDHYSSAMPLSSSLSDRFGGLSIGENKRESGSWDEGFSTESPTSVIENNRSECQNVEAGRVTLPKSISVRSNAFLKMSQAATGAGGSISGTSHATPRIRAQNHVPGPQKVYVRGGSRKDGSIELEVYNQGMFKTELCNKWQETGACPYGDHCQFAHGIAELRPVIRHPRYKTEVCRMVLAGDPCPYGHRCHFRHALTEEEKLMIPLGQPHHHPARELC